MGNKEPSYTVEAIVGKKMVKGEPFYLVKWKDYDSHQNTWEPFRNLANCKDLVSKFERKEESDQAAAKKRRSSESDDDNDDSDTDPKSTKRRKTLVLTNSDSESPESLGSSETSEESVSSSSEESRSSAAAPCILVAFRDRENRLLFVFEFEDGEYRVVDAKTARKQYREALTDFLNKDAK